MPGFAFMGALQQAETALENVTAPSPAPFDWNRMHVGNADLGDVNGISGIETVCFSPDEQDGPDDIEQLIRVNPNGSIVARYDEAGQRKLIGHISSIRVDELEAASDFDLEPCDHSPSGKYIFIWSVAVYPGYREKGVASMLIFKLAESEMARTGRTGETLIFSAHADLRDFYVGRIGAVVVGAHPVLENELVFKVEITPERLKEFRALGEAGGTIAGNA